MAKPKREDPWIAPRPDVQLIKAKNLLVGHRVYLADVGWSVVLQVKITTYCVSIFVGGWKSEAHPDQELEVWTPAWGAPW